jgi:hypothetical protein
VSQKESLDRFLWRAGSKLGGKQVVPVTELRLRVAVLCSATGEKKNQGEGGNGLKTEQWSQFLLPLRPAAGPGQGCRTGAMDQGRMLTTAWKLILCPFRLARG